jgi:amino acid adenylation domain-containing protein
MARGIAAGSGPSHDVRAMEIRFPASIGSAECLPGPVIMSGEFILQRLMRLAAEAPDRPIYRSEAGRLDRAGLRGAMLRIAGWLRTAGGIAAGDRVAVCLPKSLETVQAIYGILAAGAVYVPLPFQGPPERLGAMLAAIRPRLLLTDAEVAGRIDLEPLGDPRPTVRPLNPGDGIDALLPAAGVPPLEAPLPVRPDDLAAVFFTSGSTGEPKGVMWSHRGMAAATAALPRWGAMTEADRLISLGGLHYAAAADIFYPLHAGCSLYLASEREAMFALRIAEVLERERTTIWSATATALRLLVEGGDLAGRDLGALRRVEMYGEPMQIPVLRRAMAALPQAAFFNLYAASEAFDMVEYAVPRPLPEGLAALPLGRPSPTYDLVLRGEDDGEAAPSEIDGIGEVGEVGEICVRGEACLLGYWGDPAMTQARRLDGSAGSFRSGDLAFRGPDGLLHLVGRRDNMVKLRGHRFHLGEIEAVLRSHEEVREAVAFLCGAPGEEEARAVVLAGTDRALTGELAELCSRRLPGFARPAAIIIAARFPQLASGKVDRLALRRLVDGAGSRDSA